MSVLGILLLSGSMAQGAAAAARPVDRGAIQGQVVTIATAVAKKLGELPVVREFDVVSLKKQSDEIKAYATSVYADLTRITTGLPKGDPIIKTAVDAQRALLVKIAKLKGAMITAETIIALSKIEPATTQQGLEDQVVDIQKRILPKFLTEINEATIKSGTSSIQTRGKDAILAKANGLRALQLPLGGRMTPVAGTETKGAAAAAVAMTSAQAVVELNKAIPVIKAIVHGMYLVRESRVRAEFFLDNLKKALEYLPFKLTAEDIDSLAKTNIAATSTWGKNGVAWVSFYENTLYPALNALGVKGLPAKIAKAAPASPAEPEGTGYQP